MILGGFNHLHQKKAPKYNGPIAAGGSINQMSGGG
jgi:hypothetical protein